MPVRVQELVSENALAQIVNEVAAGIELKELERYYSGLGCTVLLYLVEHGYVNLEDLYIDGSKWEANANKHKVVWRKNTERYKGQVLERIAELLEEFKELQQAEDASYGNKDLAGRQSYFEFK